MQQGSLNKKEQNNRIVHHFIQGFLDKRNKGYKQLKQKNLELQKIVETRISQESDLKCLLSRYEDDPWVKKILISYVLMYHYASSWDVKEPYPKSKKNKPNPTIGSRFFYL